jgi:predicted O-linked N-acetylglucosamine transferase (SPINDLY family)
LRIGYVSADFRDHVIGRNLLPLFRHHDRTKFEVICYADVAHGDAKTEEFRRGAERWQSIVGLDDAACAEMIRRDEVDILVDLSQHLEGNRLAVFARQPAQVQVSFAGYPASTGLETIGARISDRYLESKIEDRKSEIEAELRTEEQVFLLDSFWCYDPAGASVEVNALPAMKNGFVTFGCLNNFCKINEPVLRLWARVLRQVAGSRLALLTPPGSHRQRLVDFLEREGIAGPRVIFSSWLPRASYLALYHSIDIVLDAFPYHGHTTSLDALWMGVPIVSLIGERAVSRAGLGQLTQLDLPEWAAFSTADYVQIAVERAADLPRLASLRASLRPRMERSPLMDAPRFARGIEVSYRALWRRCCVENPAFTP